MPASGTPWSLETFPGRIEASCSCLPIRRRDPAAGDRRSSPIGAAVKAANTTLGPNQRVAAWRVWHGEDFPRTHTLKVKRDQVRTWAAVEATLPVSEGS